MNRLTGQEDRHHQIDRVALRGSMAAAQLRYEEAAFGESLRRPSYQ
jgi:hypothetical protein